MTSTLNSNLNHPECSPNNFFTNLYSNHLSPPSFDPMVSTRHPTRSSGASSSKTRPASTQSVRPQHNRVSARSLALPHSSGDTVPVNDMPIRSSPSAAYDGAANDQSKQINGVNHMTSGRSNTSSATVPHVAGSALEMLGCSVKVLLHAIRDLERHGIDAAASIPLPKIVVVGDQSAGKSSLIEAISEITVPRDSGTCTRCVLHINLRDEPSSDWRCDVSLVQKYHYAEELTSSPLYPWAEMEQEITPFTTVYDKRELEHVIRRAQLATLNPSQNPRLFSPLREVSSSSTEVAFSPNIISLEIAAPGLPNLSFYDLPGVISQFHDGRKDTPRLIAGLAASYIQQENTIILLAVPMESDIDNSKASALVNECGATDRTIGVLTKPDRLQSDDRVDAWTSVLEGKEFRMGHGYFVVKQPSQTEINQGITNAQARNLEEEFFKSPRWSQRFGDVEVERLGTRNLQRNLSDKLAHLILEVMPHLEMQVTRKLAEVEDELADLPEPPPNAMQVVTQAIMDFSQDFSTKVQATEPNALSREWKQLKSTFHDAIESRQRPTIKLSTDHEAAIAFSKVGKSRPKPTPSKGKRTAEVIDLSSDDEMIDTPSRKKVASPVKREESVATSSQTDRDPLRKQFSLSELRSTLESFSTSGLPSEVELKAVDHLMLSTLKNWNVPLDLLINHLRLALGRALASSLRDKVGQWRTTKLFEEMHTINVSFLDERLNCMKSHVNRGLRLERTKPITRDEALMKRYISDEHAKLSDARMRARYSAHLMEAAEQSGRDVSAPMWDEKTRKHAASVLNADAFAREIDVMAKIRAYYQIAGMRFVDQVVQAVEAELFLSFREELLQELMSAMDMYGENGFANANRLVADDPQREERRSVLKEKKSRLEQAGERIGAMHRDFFMNNAITMEA